MKWSCIFFAGALSLLPACSALRSAVAPSPQPTYYSLATAQSAGSRPAASRSNGLTLIVSPPHAAAGFDSPRMMYLRHSDQLEYFARNEWIDTPARMLAPLIVSALDSRGTFGAVVLTPSPAEGDLRLDTEIMRLQQEFFTHPSVVRFGLRAYLVEAGTRRVVAAREFEAVADAPSDDPRGGVTAAHEAVKRVLAQLAEFCAQTVSHDATRVAAPR
jgi:cholesterol transport system auxiliary component